MNEIFLTISFPHIDQCFLFQEIVFTENVQDSLKDLPDCTKLFIAYSDRPYCHLTLDSHTQYVCDTRTNATGIYI